MDRQPVAGIFRGGFDLVLDCRFQRTKSEITLNLLQGSHALDDFDYLLLEVEAAGKGGGAGADVVSQGLMTVTPER
jgi:hypothetical protein